MVVMGVIPGHPASIHEARSLADTLRGRVSGRSLDAVRLVISELVSNGVVHGRSAHVEARFWQVADHIHIEVSDGGLGFGGVAPGALDLGLVLVARIAERWGVLEGWGETTVWADVPIDTPMDEIGEFGYRVA